jgi:hypothetical protein
MAQPVYNLYSGMPCKIILALFFCSQNLRSYEFVSLLCAVWGGDSEIYDLYENTQIYGESEVMNV